MTVPPVALRMTAVTKRYGSRSALRGLSLEVPRGSITGFIGPNGAGKTTTFGIVGGLVRPDTGTVDVLGQGAFDPARHAGRVALLPQDAELPPHAQVRDTLVYLARLQGHSARDASREADRVLDLVSLGDRPRSRIGELSHGMRRRVALAQCFLGEPELVLLDEPTSGLDPHLVVLVRELLAKQRGKRTLLVSSHVLAELESVCDHVIFIEGGQVVRAGTLDAITGREGMVRVRINGAVALGPLRDALDGARVEHDGDELVFYARDAEDTASLNARVLPLLLAQNVGIVEVRRGLSLERVYMESRATKSA